ncbi:MAG: chaperone modulator CbpM [Weeksellaceae bacterium]
MKIDKLILISELRRHYKLSETFFEEVEYFELMQIQNISNQKYILKKELRQLEKIIRLHDDLEINMQGIDVIMHLTDRINVLKQELQEMKRQLALHEN